ncbi:MAG: T9SS type A sorting domain-containing protein [Bacteroidales bacterium]|nr:T9SS type A sorting domain-containing protein [Bacteroidales bacterium]
MSKKKLYFYGFPRGLDVDGNVILHFHEYWDENTNEWKFQDEEKYETVVTDSVKQVVTYDWDESTSKWNLSIRLTFYYSDPGVTSIHNVSSAELKVYPNPATEFVVFDGIESSGSAYVELFDIQGKIVLSQTIDHNQKVYVQQLYQGLYLYKYSMNGKTYTGKLIIK